MTGEIADDAINGFCCSWCGTYFDGMHGYPVVCKWCSDGHSNDELIAIGLQRATYKELSG